MKINILVDVVALCQGGRVEWDKSIAQSVECGFIWIINKTWLAMVEVNDLWQITIPRSLLYIEIKTQEKS